MIDLSVISHLVPRGGASVFSFPGSSVQLFQMGDEAIAHLAVQSSNGSDR